MMRFCVRFALGLVVTLLMSSMASAQVAPGAIKVRDPLLKRGFRQLSFGHPASTSSPARPAVGWPEMRFRALETLGAPLPSVTTAPEPHGTTVPCVMRTVPVDPRQKSNMPVVSVDDRADPKGVVKIPTCVPRE